MSKTHVSASFNLLPEWAEQEAVVLAWPHSDSDWLPWINEARATYLKLINAINDAGASVILLCTTAEIGLARSMINMRARVIIVEASYNDTWTRDYVFLTAESDAGNRPIDFQFNGWGQKFTADADNHINDYLAPLCMQAMTSYNTVLEGGAIEIDQNQVLMSTRSCLLNPKRNKAMTESQYKSLFTDALGAKQSVIFQHGHLEGDDTDGHIDTLARFTPLRGIVLQSCFNRIQDNHFAPLHAMKTEIKMQFPDYSLFELPLPHVLNADGERLPASYANFLICNQHVLTPIYQQPEDEQAIQVLQKAFPNHQIVPIDCSAIVQQYGSLHCITMQIPVNTIRPDILALANQGVHVL